MIFDKVFSPKTGCKLYTVTHSFVSELDYASTKVKSDDFAATCMTTAATLYSIIVFRLEYDVTTVFVNKELSFSLSVAGSPSITSARAEGGYFIGYLVDSLVSTTTTPY